MINKHVTRISGTSLCTIHITESFCVKSSHYTDSQFWRLVFSFFQDQAFFCASLFSCNTAHYIAGTSTNSHQFAGLHSEWKRSHPCSKGKNWTEERRDVCSVRSCVIHRSNPYVSLANTLRVDILFTNLSSYWRICYFKWRFREQPYTCFSKDIEYIAKSAI